MPKDHTEKYHLAMAGEYFVAAQLQRLGLMASITYGNAKRADVIAFSESSDRVVVVEVRTTELNSILAPRDDVYCRKCKANNGEEFGDRRWVVNISTRQGRVAERP